MLPQLKQLVFMKVYDQSIQKQAFQQLAALYGLMLQTFNLGICLVR